MTDTKLIIAVAKLDGWKYVPRSIGQKEHFVDSNDVWGSELLIPISIVFNILLFCL